MKRFFPIIISLIMITTLLFTGCDTGEKKLSVNGSLDATSELLTDAFGDEPSFDKFTDTVSTWAKDNGIDVSTVNDKYLVLSKGPSKTATSTESFTFHTAIDLSSEDRIENSIEAASAVMTALYSPDNHGAIRGIFTLVENGQAIGAEALNNDYLSYDNFIDISYSKDELLCNSISTSSDLEAYKTLNLTEPQYTEAYQITLTGKTNQSAYKNRGTYPNPIQTIGDLLASCQTSSVLFELASFNGGEATDMIPSSATATIVLHENDVERFTTRFEKSFKKIEKIYDDIGDDDVTFEYTMTPVELPSIVISKDDTENIVSLMYTMINGNYHRDEDTDEVIAVSNLGKISTSDDQFILDINAKSLDSEIMNELHTVVETVCGLCDIQYREVSTTPSWTNGSASPMVSSLSDIMKLDVSSSLESKAAAVLVSKKSDLNLVIWNGNSGDYDDGLEEIFEYMAIAGTKIPDVNQ